MVWQRRCILVLNDEDIALMVGIFENKQRLPIEVIKKCYIEFRRNAHHRKESYYESKKVLIILKNSKK